MLRSSCANIFIRHSIVYSLLNMSTKEFRKSVDICHVVITKKD